MSSHWFALHDFFPFRMRRTIIIDLPSEFVRTNHLCKLHTHARIYIYILDTPSMFPYRYFLSTRIVYVERPDCSCLIVQKKEKKREIPLSSKGSNIKSRYIVHLLVTLNRPSMLGFDASMKMSNQTAKVVHLSATSSDIFFHRDNARIFST